MEKQIAKLSEADGAFPWHPPTTSPFEESGHFTPPWLSHLNKDMASNAGITHSTRAHLLGVSAGSRCNIVRLAPLAPQVWPDGSQNQLSVSSRELLSDFMLLPRDLRLLGTTRASHLAVRCARLTPRGTHQPNLTHINLPARKHRTCPQQ